MQKFKYLLLVCFVLTSLISSAQNCSSDERFKVLDFWLGNWQVFDKNNKLIGTNRIQKVLGGCAIQEFWLSGNGNEGQSLFYLDVKSEKWKQVWVTPNALSPGGQKEKELVLQEPGQKVIFEGWYFNSNGKKLRDRTILSKVSAQEVIQEIQISPYDSENWQTVFMGVYKRN